MDTGVRDSVFTTETQRTLRYIFFRLLGEAANENHQPCRAKMIAFPPQEIVFPIVPPNKQENKNASMP